MKPLDDWNEEYIADLPSGENDSFDRKGSQALVDCSTGTGSDKKRIDLSCDVSAFANSGGGFLIFGVNNAGTVDGGVSTRLKSIGTHDWLDTLVGDLVEPMLRGYRIKEILPAGSGSKINANSAIYVLSIPDSENAPHQAKDAKYYTRINAHNYAMRHKQIEDIRGRRRNPKLSLVGRVVQNYSHPQGRSQVLISIVNQAGAGPARAPHVALQSTTVAFQVSQWGLDGKGITFLRQIPAPIGSMPAIFVGDSATVILPGTRMDLTCIDYVGDLSTTPRVYQLTYELNAEGMEESVKETLEGPFG